MKALITELKHRLNLVHHRITAIAAEQTLLASEEEYLKKLLEQYEKQYYDTIVEERRITEAVTIMPKQKDRLPNGAVSNAVEIFIRTCPENHFSYSELVKHIDEYLGKKVSAGSIGPALKKMIKQRLISKADRGKYTINK